MAEMQGGVDFDTRPPVPLSDYETMSRRVNVGYELLFNLTHCLLRGLHRPVLELLVVGVGGGAEIERFLPGNPGWRLTGVDPSEQMLQLAQAKAHRLGVADRVTLVRGTVQDLAQDAQFGAATCMFVLHFLPDEGKLQLMKETARRLRPGAPLLAAAGSAGDDDGLTDLLWAGWQEFGVAAGLPEQQMAGVLAEIRSRGKPATPDDYVRLLRAASFKQVTLYFNALNVIWGWLAR